MLGASPVRRIGKRLLKAVQVLVRPQDRGVLGRIQRAQLRVFVHHHFLPPGIFHVKYESIQACRGLNSQDEGSVFGAATMVEWHRGPYAFLANSLVEFMMFEFS